MSRLKGYVAQNTQRWQSLKAQVDTYLVNNANGSIDAAIPLGLAYQASGDKRYAQLAISLITNFCVPTQTLTQDSYYWYRTALPAASACLDWCYDQMTPAQRTQVATWLMDRADNVWPDTNPARIGGWGTDTPANNYFYGFMMTWPAALAAAGDDPRAATHIALGLYKYRNYVRAYTDGWGKGGLFAESTNYDATFNVALQLDAHLTATGQDLINEPGFTFLRDSIYWRIHSTTPGRDGYYILGDQPRVASGPLSDLDRNRALGPTATLNDSATASFGKFWLDNINPTMNSWLPAWEFLYYIEGAPSADYTAGQPLSYFASGPGILLKHQNWTADATYWGIWAGPLQQEHQNRDVNGFLIYKGGWLVGNATMWSQDGQYSQTEYQNNLTFGVNQQYWLDTSTDSNRALKVETTDEYSYFAGNGTSAYNRSQAVAKDYVRKFVSLGDNVFLIYDRATAFDQTQPKFWHLQSPSPITVQGRNYQFNNGKYQIQGQSLLPVNGTSLSTDTFGFGYNNANSSYRLRVSTNNQQPTDYLLNVLQVSPLSQPSAASAQTVTASTGNMEGAQINNWVVLFGKSERVTGPVTYTVQSAVPLQHLLLDLSPSANYQVTVLNVTTGASTTATKTVTSQGSLRMNLPAGNFTVTLTPPTLDVTPPAAPTGLQTAGDDMRVNESWNPNKESDLAGYNVYMSSSPNGPWSIKNRGLVTGTTFSINNLINGQIFYFAVSAVDTSGNESPLSAPVVGVPNPAGAPPVIFTISGTVTANGAGLAGVTVTSGKLTATTAADGTYSLMGLASGSYTVSASLTAYTLTAAQTVTVGPNQTVNFTATPVPTYTVSGAVTVNGAGLSGVTVSAGSQNATTAADGTYTLSKLLAGTYTVSAVIGGYTFDPQQVTVGPSQTVNFAITQPAAATTAGGLVLGANMNGPAVKIEGNQWLSQSAAQSKGLSVLNAQTWSGTYLAPLSPAAPDADTTTMLQSAVLSGTSVNGQGFRVKQNLPNGSYQVYLWMGEPYRDHYRDVNVLFNGTQVATGIGDLVTGQWQKYGPYPVTVTAGVLNIDLLRATKGQPMLMGMAIFDGNAPATTNPPTTTTNPPSTTTNPPSTTTNPPSTTTDPTTTTNPPTTTTNPPSTTTNPPSTTTNPPSTTTNPPATTTVLGVNLGDGAVKIEGNQWLSFTDAQANGLTVTNSQIWKGGYGAPFSPATDTDSTTMLQSAVLSPVYVNGQGMRVSQKLANGTYQVYLWMGEPYRDHFRDVNVLFNGTQVATGIGDLLTGQWQKYGPYTATVTNGVLNIDLLRATKGQPMLMGMLVTGSGTTTTTPPATSPNLPAVRVNLGDGAVTVGGNQWLSFTDAQANGLTVTNSQIWKGGYGAPFSPALPDAGTGTMLQSAVLSPVYANGQGMRVSQALANGSYQVYLWMGEPYRDHFRDVNVLFNGNQVATGIGDLVTGQWQKYGPYTATVTNGVLNIDLLRATKGQPMLMGLEILPGVTALDTSGTISSSATPTPGFTVNAGGDAVTVNGEQWLSFTGALANGLTAKNYQLWNGAYLAPFSPAVTDPALQNVLQSGILSPTNVDGQGLNLSQTVANGTYQVYLWMGEPYRDHYRSMNVLLNGTQVASGVGDLVTGQWQKYGPYPVTVTDGQLKLNVVRAGKGEPLLLGFKIVAQ